MSNVANAMTGGFEGMAPMQQSPGQQGGVSAGGPGAASAVGRVVPGGGMKMGVDSMVGGGVKMDTSDARTGSNVVEGPNPQGVQGDTRASPDTPPVSSSQPGEGAGVGGVGGVASSVPGGGAGNEASNPEYQMFFEYYLSHLMANGGAPPEGDSTTNVPPAANNVSGQGNGEGGQGRVEGREGNRGGSSSNANPVSSPLSDSPVEGQDRRGAGGVHHSLGGAHGSLSHSHPHQGVV